jgi:hypothetical protein
MRYHVAARKAFRISVCCCECRPFAFWCRKPLNSSTVGTNVIRRRLIEPIKIEKAHPGSIEKPASLEKPIILAMQANEIMPASRDSYREFHIGFSEYLGIIGMFDVRPPARLK